MTLYLARGESLPCARVSSNVFCTRYEFIKNHTVGPFDAPWQPAKRHESLCLADVEYRTRIRGCMRPRRQGFPSDLSLTTCRLASSWHS